MRTTQASAKVFDDKAFIDGVFNGEYMLVVGSGVILDRNNFPESGGDINKYIINIINEERSSERSGFVKHKNFTDVSRGTPLDEIDPIYKLLSDQMEYEIGDMSPELVQLLRTRLFRFVLTTCIDSYLETLMRDIWGKELCVVNISDNQSLKDFKNSLEQCRVNKYSRPTLFYVFGKVTPGRPKPRGYVETDVDAIKIVEKWMKEVDTNYIVPFLKGKRMLALGCKFDDWYFRFFWYILTRGFYDADREGSKDIDGSLLTSDNLAVMFNENDPSDMQLRDYLQQRGVCMHDDVWPFMQHIHTLLTSTAVDSPFREFILEKRRQGGIFISYKSCDVTFAAELFCKLAREKGLNVWFDNISLHGGDEYKIAIKEVIKKARVFIPILSSSVAEELKVNGENITTFYSDEWRWAAKNSNIKILPIAIDGYNLRDEINKIFERIIGREPSGIDMNQKANLPDNSEKVGYSKLLDDIMFHLDSSLQ